MADFFLVSSGNWSNAAIWSATSGGVGGAGVPSTGDSARLTLGSHTLNLDGNISIDFFYTSLNFTGTFNTNNYNITSNRVQLDRGTINMGSTVWTTSIFRRFQTSNPLTMNVGTSRVVFDGLASADFGYGDLLFNEIDITNWTTTQPVILSQLIANTIIAKPSGTRTLYINNSTVSVRKIIIKGASTSNRMIINKVGGSNGVINLLDSNQIIAGENIAITNTNTTGAGVKYLANSVDNGNTSGWTFSAAPKVDTLVDAFSGSTINTARWTAVGSGLSQSGGQLIFTPGSGVTTASLISKEQFLGEGSSIQFKAGVSTGSLTVMFANASLQYGITAMRNIPDIYLYLSTTEGRFYINAGSSYASTTFPNAYTYYRIRESSGTIYLDGSNDGIAYTNVKSAVGASYGLDTTQLIARPIFNFYADGGTNIIVDDLNIELEPTAQFTSSETSGNTPLTVNFTDQSNFAPTSWLWNFGDSTTSTLQNPSKTYSAPGTYTVSLQSSNSSYTRSVSKSNLITASPNIYTRAISGTLIFGGTVTRRLLASRSISGGLVFGGSVRAVLLRDVEGVQGKRFLYKVYDEDGTYLETWGKKVISELAFTHEMNTIGSSTEVELAINSDSVGVTDEILMTEDNQNLLTENDLDILATTETRNQIGSGTSVEYNNRVDIIAFYGSVEPLLTESEEAILTEGDEELLADIGAPNGRRIFTGFISEINSRYGNSETTVVKLSTYGWDLDQFPLTNSAGETTVVFNSYDPSDIAREAIDKFVVDSAPYNTYTDRTLSSIASTGSEVSYTFRSNTYAEVMDKILELMPSNWYYRVDLGENIIYFRQRSVQPQHLFYLGKHIHALDLKGSIISSTNRVLYTGGGEPSLYIDTAVAPAPRTRRTLAVLSDSRVTEQDSAEIISNSKIGQENKILYRTTVEILSGQYDIETIAVGDTVGWRNFDNYVDSLTLQVVGLSYTADSVQLQLETKPPTINKRLEDIRRNLTVTDNTYLPVEPIEVL